MRLEHIQIENFLGARRVDVQLQKRVNIFAGANAAGKSSIQEAVRMALTREPVRVELKKEYGALLSEGAEGGFAEVTFDTGHAVVTLPNGKFNDYPMPAALPYVIDAQRFAHLPVNERRAFLFGLMGLKTDGEAVRKRLLDRGLDALKIDRVQSMLRAGFEPACKEAKAKATEAKGAWRAVTGETYGSEKVKTWHAPKPAFDAAAQAKAATELKHADVALESWQQTIGKLGAEEARRAALKAKLPALHDHAAMVQRFETKLGVDEASLADLDATIARTATAAGGGPRIGLVHDLARAIRADPAGVARDRASPLGPGARRPRRIREGARQARRGR